MNLPTINSLKLEKKRVLLRADLDLDFTEENSQRLKVLIDLLLILIEKEAVVTIIGHKGRPEGRVEEKLSLKPLSEKVEKLLEEQIGKEKMKTVKIKMAENLRFEMGEEKNEKDFAERLVHDQDFFINEAFAASHRKHASVVTLPKLLPSALGPHFVKEIENLEKVFDQPKKPTVFIISGVKSGKMSYVEKIGEKADKVLVGGRLPESIHDASLFRKNSKFVIANLIADKEDITMNSIEAFEKEIQKAGTIVVNGPLGKFEDEAHRQGTKRVFEKVARTKAFKVAGGGETEKALRVLSLEKDFDWISVGGGAMLEFLTTGTLPAIEALIN